MKTKKTNKTNQINKINSNAHPYDSQWMELPVDRLEVISKNKLKYTDNTYASNFVKSGRHIKIYKNGSIVGDEGIIYDVDMHGFKVWMDQEKFIENDDTTDILPTDTIDRIEVAIVDIVDGGPYVFNYHAKTKNDVKISIINEKNKFMPIGNKMEVYINMEFKLIKSELGNIKGLYIAVPITDGRSSMNFFDMVFVGFAENVTDKTNHNLYITVFGDDFRMVEYGYKRDYVGLYLDSHPEHKDPNRTPWEAGKTYKITGNYYYYLI